MASRKVFQKSKKKYSPHNIESHTRMEIVYFKDKLAEAEAALQDILKIKREKMAAPKVSKKVKKEEVKTKKTKIGKGMTLPRGKAEKLREKPGMSSVGKWKNVGKKDFAGPNGTFPIMDIAHARNALARAHFAKNPGEIKRKVYAKYPGLKKRHEEREGKSK